MTQIKQVNVRFAPSPTGLLHIGNVRAVLFNWLFARRHGGIFMLRLDDTDRERSREDLAQFIERDLRWLGLEWDKFARQSDRMERYHQALADLKAKGRVYACYETQEELGLKRKAQLGRGLPPIYDRGALKLTDAEKQKLETEGRKPHWRFLLNDEDVIWDDAVQGQKNFAAAALSDPVLVREDGVPLYTFCSVVDDADFAISHVIRGEDHVTNTAVQIQIWRALTDLPPPGFAHFPLLVSGDGIEMSKRLGTLSIASMRDDMGIEAMAINSLVARIGTSDPVIAAARLEELVPDFSLDKISHGTPKFEVAELQSLSARILHGMPYAEAAPRLAGLGFGEVDENFWNMIRPNLTKLADVGEWWQVARGPVTPQIDDPAFAEQALSVLPAEPWDTATWNAWTAAVKAKTGKGGKDLFMPLRLALTGHAHGPELKLLLPQIGEHRVRERLMGRAA
ncbi:MAG: glutamate--tRNA ligase [Alphaproteobacteria bacterium]